MVSHECTFQHANYYLPFGGVGNSGIGRYLGKVGFQSMSNVKGLFDKIPLNMYPFSVRYPPYTPHKYFMLKMMTKYLAFP